MKRYILSIAILSTFLFCFSSCDSFLKEYSQDLVVAKKVEHFDELLLGSVYLHSDTKYTYPTASSVGGFFNILDDDVSTGRGKGVPHQTSKAWNEVLNPMFGYYAWQLEIGRNFRATSTAADDVTWNVLYEKIGYINVILDEIERVDKETEEERESYHRVVGEARFLRGYFYFVLANLYGDAYSPSNKDVKLNVPLKLTPYVEHDKEKETQFVRATTKEVYDQILTDLNESVANFEKVGSTKAKKNYRASKTSAHLLLGRVYLYMQDWEKAEYHSDLALKDNRYYLEGLASFSVGKVFFRDDNSEVIFSQGNNHLASVNVFTAGPGDLCVSSDLYNSFAGDKDVRTNFFSVNSYTDSLTFNNKYIKGELRSRISDVFTLRYSEALLNRAEACAMQSGKESIANNDLFKIRANRIKEYVREDFSGEKLVDEIRLERRRELCFEGHRWFDLRRYAVNEKYPFEKEIKHDLNIANDNIDYVSTNTYVLGNKDDAYTFPIPKSVIEFDKTPMTQNPRQKRLPLDKPETENNTDGGLDDDDDNTGTP